ncbi:unnamed protein product [Colias eurytheme]|nr:unnamed protein product [Colias eurytheme]
MITLVAGWLFPYLKTDHAGKEVHNLALSLGLTQLVKEATRIPDVDGHTANCLDLLLTTDPERYSTCVSSPLGSSDHCLVKAITTYSPPEPSTVKARRIWRYSLADWDEMRHFFASYPWRRICFSSNDPTNCASAIEDVIRQAMEYFIPFSDVSSGGKEQPWYNADCRRAEYLKHQAYRAWADARARKDPDISTKKRNFNKAAKSFKLTLKRTRLNRISQIGDKLISYPSGSKAFWSLAKAVEANFCKTSLPPLLKPDGALAHSAREKADLFANLFANNSRLDDGNKVPPSLPHCGLSMPEFRITQKEVIKCLRSLDVNKASGPDDPVNQKQYAFSNCLPNANQILDSGYESHSNTFESHSPVLEYRI